MHELPVIQRILDVVLRHAKANNVNKILSIKLEIGELSDLENEWMQRYFDYLSKGTTAENAKLLIQRTPVVLKCDSCERTFEVDIKKIDTIQCPDCGKTKCSLVSGKGYYIKDMEVI